MTHRNCRLTHSYRHQRMLISFMTAIITGTLDFNKFCFFSPQKFDPNQLTSMDALQHCHLTLIFFIKSQQFGSHSQQLFENYLNKTLIEKIEV